MKELNTKKKLWVARQFIRGVSATKIARAQKINRCTVYRIVQKYKTSGETGLKKQRRGVLFQPLNGKFYGKVMDEWKRNKCGSVKLHRVLRKQGFGVSQRKIQQVLDTEKLTKPCKKRRGQRKYKRFEWPLSDLMWHTDWKELPTIKKHFIAFLDDHSRFITGYGLFDGATTKNTLFVLYNAITKHGVPYQILTDRGPQFYANKMGRKKRGKCDFEIALEEMGIIHVKSRAHHPQTNGKVERFYGIIEREFDERFKNIHEFIKWYNEKRLSQALDYKTPKEVYESDKW